MQSRLTRGKYTSNMTFSLANEIALLDASSAKSQTYKGVRFQYKKLIVRYIRSSHLARFSLGQICYQICSEEDQGRSVGQS